MEKRRFLSDAARIEQPRQDIAPRGLRAALVVHGQQFFVDKVAHQTLDLTVAVIQRHFAGQDLLVLAIVHTAPRDIVERHPFMENLVFIVFIALGMDMPAQILVVFPANLLHRGKAVIIQERLARADKAAIRVLPENAQQIGADQIVPHVLRLKRPLRLGPADTVFQIMDNAFVDVPNQHEKAILVELEQGELLPGVLSVADTGAKHL